MIEQVTFFESRDGREVPIAPPEEHEQLRAPLEGTIEGRYRQWRATPEGRAAFAEIERLALLEADAGAARVEVNEIMAHVRRTGIVVGATTVHLKLNNSFRSRIARELRAAHPALRPLIAVRELSAT